MFLSVIMRVASCGIIFFFLFTYFRLIISFEHVADTLLICCSILYQTGKVAGILAVVDQLVDLLWLVLKQTGANQRIPLLVFPHVRFTSQARW